MTSQLHPAPAKSPTVKCPPLPPAKLLTSILQRLQSRPLPYKEGAPAVKVAPPPPQSIPLTLTESLTGFLRNIALVQFVFQVKIVADPSEKKKPCSIREEGIAVIFFFLMITVALHFE